MGMRGKIFCAINIFLITRNNNNQSKSLQDFTLVRPILFFLINFWGQPTFFGKYWMPNMSDRYGTRRVFKILGQLGRALQWTPKLGFNLPPTVRQWIRVWSKHAPSSPLCRISLWLSSVAASSTSQPLTFLRHFLLQSLNPLAWFSTHWIELFCLCIIFLIEFSSDGTTSATVWGFC